MKRILLAVTIFCIIQTASVPQEIKLDWLGQSIGGEMGGMAVSGNYVFLGSGDNLIVFNRQGNKFERETIINLDYQTSYLRLVENFLYVMTQENGFFIFDVSNPANPIKKGFQTINHQFQANFLEYIWVNGNYAYVPRYDMSWEIYNIANPENITKEYSSSAAKIRLIVADGNYAYTLDKNGDLRIFDVSNLSAVSEKSNMKISDAKWTYGLIKRGNYLFIAAGNNGYNLINVSDPSNPQKVDQISISFGINDMYITGNTMYAKSNMNYMPLKYYSIDITNPTTPQLNGEFQFDDGFGWQYWADGNQLITCCRKTKDILREYDFSNPNAPILTRSYQHPLLLSAMEFVKNKLLVTSSENIFVFKEPDGTNIPELEYILTDSKGRFYHFENDRMYSI